MRSSTNLHPFSPALYPVRRALLRIPLDWRPFLHPLRLLRVVRELLRYYFAIRLPVPVYHWLTPLGFPTQPAVPSSHRAGTGSPDSRSGCFGACTRSPTTQSLTETRTNASAVLPSSGIERVGALKFLCISWLNTRPALSPANASPVGLLPSAHGSGSAWLAMPLLFETFTHDILPVFIGAPIAHNLL